MSVETTCHHSHYHAAGSYEWDDAEAFVLSHRNDLCPRISYRRTPSLADNTHRKTLLERLQIGSKLIGLGMLSHLVEGGVVDGEFMVHQTQETTGRPHILHNEMADAKNDIVIVGRKNLTDRRFAQRDRYQIKCSFHQGQKRLFHETLEQLHLIVRNDGHFLRAGWNHRRLACMEEHSVPLRIEEAALSAQTHVDAEGICLVALAGIGSIQLQFIGGKEWTADKLCDRITLLCILHLGIFCDISKIDSFEGKLSMQFAQVAITISTQIVIDAIGDIAGLLNLSNHHACSDSMNTTCRDIEAVSWIDTNLVKVVLDASVCHFLGIISNLCSLAESCNELTATISIHDVPHLVFTHLTMTALAELIIWMHLDAQVLASIDELDEQREIIAEALVILLSHEVGSIFLEDLRKCHTSTTATQNNRLRTFHSRDDPSL